MKHVVMFSGGITSWYTATLAAQQLGQLFLLFADVGGHHDSPHDGEDEDCYRFIHEATEQLGGTLITLNQGENIWDVFKRRKYLGNSRQANCSIELKQKPCRQWLEDNCSPDDTTVYVGIDWTETHRLPKIQNAYLPFTAVAPLTEPPYVDKPQMLRKARELGLRPPRMYDVNFGHANCGGGCVRAGHATFAKLLQWNPDRYAYWETNEQQIRDQLGDVTILRDWNNGGAPLTLREFRRRQETDQLDLFDADDVGGCGCFTD